MISAEQPAIIVTVKQMTHEKNEKNIPKSLNIQLYSHQQEKAVESRSSERLQSSLLGLRENRPELLFSVLIDDSQS